MTGMENITILMGVRNGALYLPAQLHSIAAQRGVAWQIWASDDGSEDASPSILRAFARQNGDRNRILEGPQEGFATNYLSLLRLLPEAPGAVAFSDQDDIWMPDKLSRGLDHLAKAGEGPALYCARRWDWYPMSGKRCATDAPRKEPSFRNALIENIAFGNTILLNPAAARLARIAALRSGPVFAHDWWLYLLITGVGGKVIFDRGEPSILYRQHPGNALGAGRGLAAAMARKRGVMGGVLRRRISQNVAALGDVADLLTPINRNLLTQFERAREAPAMTRLLQLASVNPHRQTLQGTLGYWGATLIGKA